MKTWKDVKLKAAKELLNMGDYDDPMDEAIAKLTIVLDTTEDVILNKTPGELTELLNDWKLAELPAAKFKRKFWKGGRLFVATPFNDLTTAQILDIEAYYNEFNKNIEKIMDIIWRPALYYNPFKRKWICEEYDPNVKRWGMYLEMDMQFVWENILFFYNGVITYTKDLAVSSLTKSKIMMQELMKEMEEELSPVKK